MIIDFRNRPPFGEFKNSFLFTDEAVEKYCRKFDVEHTEAVKQLSMELYEQEKKEAEIEIVVMQGNKREMGSIVELLDGKKYFAFAGLSINDPWQENEDYVNRHIIGGKFSGIMLIPSFDGILVDDQKLWPMYEKCQKENIPLMVFSGGNSKINYAENNPIHVDNVAVAFPELKLIVGHACWPYAQEMCGVGYKRSNVYLSPDIYMFRSAGYHDYAMAASYHLRDRFLFATSYPQVPMKMMVQWYKECGIRQEVWHKIFYENAAKILGLDI